MRTSTRLFWGWLVFAGCCSWMMWEFPGAETIPYHLAYISCAAAYGLEPWPRSRAVWSIIGFTAVTGTIIIERAATGVLAWGETAEIPLMALLMLLMVWHVRRRHDALAALTVMAERERRRAAEREHLSRMTSHELRTPATIAVGYLELMLGAETEAHKRDDLTVVLEEVERIGLGTERLIRTLAIPDNDGLQRTDLGLLLGHVLERWRVLADRDWQLDSTAGTQPCSPERTLVCLDTLVENSVRYTRDGDVVRLVSRVEGNVLSIGVADGGDGFSPALLEILLDETAAAGTDAFAADPKSQTGLGLGLVQEAVRVRDGGLFIGSAPEGGALVMMRLPLGRPGQMPTLPPMTVGAPGPVRVARS
jgi:two-component system OmpR family sensor kinase